jgi:uncharacterized protein
MADFDNRALQGRGATAATTDQGLRSYLLSVYNYMLVGLVLTGATATLVAEVPEIRSLFYHVNPATLRGGMTILGWIAFFAPLGLVLLLSARIQSMSLGAAQAMFWAFAAIYGISLSPILLVYTGADVAQAFFVTAATFGTMSLYGYTTSRDLSGWGSFLFMGLIGIFIALIVNLFLNSAAMTFVVSVIGVVVFTGLTAYDTQAIKSIYSASDDGTITGKKAVYGALQLYLDFINLFLFILRLLGSRR